MHKGGKIQHIINSVVLSSYLIIFQDSFDLGYILSCIVCFNLNISTLIFSWHWNSRHQELKNHNKITRSFLTYY